MFNSNESITIISSGGWMLCEWNGAYICFFCYHMYCDSDSRINKLNIWHDHTPHLHTHQCSIIITIYRLKCIVNEFHIAIMIVRSIALHYHKSRITHRKWFKNIMVKMHFYIILRHNVREQEPSRLLSWLMFMQYSIHLEIESRYCVMALGRNIANWEERQILVVQIEECAICDIDIDFAHRLEEGGIY